MKIAKWNEKVSAMLDDLCMENNVRYCNRDDGVVFCDELGTWLLFSPGSVVLSANNGKNCVSALEEIKEIAKIAFIVCDDECGNANKFAIS